MKGWHDVGRAVSCIVALSAAALYLCAQGAKTPRLSRLGVPQDWSSRQVVFTLDGLVQHPELLNLEPRILHQVMQRWGPELGYFRGAARPSNSLAGTIQRDWNFALGGGRLAAEIFPAKYSFDPGAPPSCQNDYVVFALSTQGVTGGQANLVGLHNLYAGNGGVCTGPNEYFAYNTTTVTGGKNATSPVLSLDGTKIAFVETTASAAVFHVLTWTANQGTMQNAANPGAAMKSLTFVNSGSTRSSPWVDYQNDIAYVGGDDGRIYKITPVFKTGTPAVVASYSLSTRPVFLLSPPVLDASRHLLMVGSGNGKLYQVNTSTGAVTSITIGGGTVNQGILGPPLVDETNGVTFVVVSDDGASGAFLEQLDTASLTVLAKARIGIGAHSGSTVKLYQPAVDYQYYTNNPGAGKIRTCGTGASDITPWQYAFAFTLTGNPQRWVMNTSPSFSQQILNTTSATCTGWTEFFNPNIPANVGTDYFFFGLLGDCGAGSSGCIKERVSDSQIVTFNLTSGPSGVVIDNYSTANPQYSNIYLTNQHAPNRAYKLTQNGLN